MNLPLSIMQEEALLSIKTTGIYQSCRHNDRTKSLEYLMNNEYPIKRAIVNKYLMIFTYTPGISTLISNTL